MQADPIATGPLTLLELRHRDGYGSVPMIETRFLVGDVEHRLDCRCDVFETFGKFQAFLLAWSAAWVTLDAGADWQQLVADACRAGHAEPVAA